MWEKIDVNQHHHSISHPRWGKTQLVWYILILETSLVFSSRLSLPFTVSLTTNFHVLNVVQHVKDIQPLSPKHITSKLKKKFLLMWYILISATSWYPPPSCPCCPQCRWPPTHMYLILSDMLKVSLMSSPITTAYQILVEENFNWSDISYFQRPPWSSCPCCPFRPQCRQPPTHMSKK